MLFVNAITTHLNSLLNLNIIAINKKVNIILRIEKLQNHVPLLHISTKKGGLFKGPPNMDFGLLLSG